MVPLGTNCWKSPSIGAWRPATHETVRDGAHEVRDDIMRLWLRCQEIKVERRGTSAGHPRGLTRHFPFSRILACHRCGHPYYGEAIKRANRVDLRLSHERRGPGRHCDARPRSRSVDALNNQFGDRVLPHLHLDEAWKRRIRTALQAEGPKPVDEERTLGLQQALANLRKQHLWGDISDDEYRGERAALERQIKLFTSAAQPVALPESGESCSLSERLARPLVSPRRNS